MAWFGYTTTTTARLSASPSGPARRKEFVALCLVSTGLMVMAVDFAGFSLRAGRQIPPTLLAATKKGPLFFTPRIVAGRPFQG
jgi:hypothetical protein